MSLIKREPVGYLIPIDFFNVCKEDNITRDEISKRYKKEEVTKNATCWYLQKFEFHLKQYNLTLKDYIKKHLNIAWPLCPISKKEVGLGKFSGKGLEIPEFVAPVTKEYSKKFKDYCDRISAERKGEGNPMFNQKAWNTGLTKDTDERVNKVAQKLIGKTVKEETKEKQRNARAKSPIKARQSTKHTPETIDKLRENTARLWAEGRFSKVTSIHTKTKEFLESLELTAEWEEEFLVKYYSLDFAFPSVKLGLECQGTYFHTDSRKYPNGPITSTQRKNAGRDKSKRKYLESKGWKIIELWEIEINNNEFKEILLCKLKELNLLKASESNPL